MEQSAVEILVGRGTADANLRLAMANRHGMISGATGTGKTISLQLLAENFSRRGVPVFLADIKGDLAGISQPGSSNPKIEERRKKLRLDDFSFSGCPVVFWDIFGQNGHPLRTTISEMGPLLLARLLNLNDVQSGVLALVFKLADDNGWLLLDLKDLRSMLQFAAEHARELAAEYGNVTTATVGSIQRGLLQLEEQGGENFFSEPALRLDDLFRRDGNGQGVINVLAAENLMRFPKLYSTFLLYLLSELFEHLPEVGDINQPKLVFFFDEAHLLFSDAPAVLLEKIEQVVRLIRSKGVGVYFISQNPTDVPDSVLAQLGNRIQHALRAFTPKEQKIIRAAADTFRPNPALDVQQSIVELAVGEALVSFLDEKGIPGIAERVLILPPRSQIGPISAEQRRSLMDNSPLRGVYEKTVDRESAYEVLKERAERRMAVAESEENAVRRPAGQPRDTILQAMAKSTVRAMGSQVGRSLIRGLLGSLFGGR